MNSSKKELNIAILILAHKDPNFLKRIIKKYSHVNIYFFIHIDNKVNIEEFNEILSKVPNVYLTPNENRVSVKWGGRSLIDAMSVLFRQASNFPIHFSRYQVISGEDYPIGSPESYLNYLQSEKNKNIEIMRIDRELDKESDKRLINLNLHDIGLINPRNYSHPVRAGLSILLGIVRQFRFSKMRTNLSIYHGSNWICLTDKAVKYILSFEDRNQDFYESFKWSFASDEVYFHTIIGNSGLEISQPLSRQPDLKNYKYANHFIDWNSGKSGPSIISSDHLDSINKLNDIFFVRKINSNNEELLDALDRLR